MSWTNIPDAHLDPESLIRDEATIRSVFWRLRDNLDAFYSGGAGAPRIQSEAFNDNELGNAKFNLLSFGTGLWQPGSVSQANLASNSIRQAEIDITVGSIYTFSDDATHPDYQQPLVNVAGYTMLGYASFGSPNPYKAAGTDYYRFGFTGPGAAGPGSALVDLNNESWADESYLFGDVFGSGALPYNEMSLYIYFVDASPPYALGEYPAHYFLYCNPLGNRLGTVAGSPTPPWIHNGPTAVIPHRRHRDGRAVRLQTRLPHAREVAARNPGLQRENAAHRSRVARKAARIERDISRLAYEAAEQVRALPEAARPRKSELRRQVREALASAHRALLADVEEIEITPTYKNADMPRIPTPYRTHNAALRRGARPAAPACLLAPCDEIAAQLAVLAREADQDLRDGRETGADPSRLLRDGYLQIGVEDDLPGAPPGVAVRRLAWRSTRGF